MPIRARDLERMFTGKLAAQRRVGKHVYFEIWDGQQQVAATMLSHGIAEYGDELLGRVARQLKVNRRQLERLVDCTMSRGDYLTHVRKQER